MKASLINQHNFSFITVSIKIKFKSLFERISIGSSFEFNYIFSSSVTFFWQQFKSFYFIIISFSMYAIHLNEIANK